MIATGGNGGYWRQKGHMLAFSKYYAQVDSLPVRWKMMYE
jgi:hypothetical protein